MQTIPAWRRAPSNSFRVRSFQLAARRIALGICIIASASALAVDPASAAPVTVVPSHVDADMVTAINYGGSMVSVDSHAFVEDSYRTTSANSRIPLQAQEPGGFAYAESLNNGNWSVGEVAPAAPADGPTLPARWSPDGRLTILGHADSGDLSNPINYVAASINSPGTVVGSMSYPATMPNRKQQAIVWNAAGQPTVLASGGRPALARSVSDCGTIAGSIGATGQNYVGTATAVTWNSSRVMKVLPKLAGDTVSVANAINRYGEVAGQSGTRGVVWSPSGKIYKLASLPGWQSSSANAVNSHGAIAGQATLADGSKVAVYWRDPQHATQLGNFTPADPEQEEYLDTDATGVSDQGVVAGWSLYHNLIGEYGQFDGAIWRP